MTIQPPGCCGDLRCHGCAWECTDPDGHHYGWDPSLGVLVCRRCHNRSPNLAAHDRGET
jgi:hypothetical protein